MPVRVGHGILASSRAAAILIILLLLLANASNKVFPQRRATTSELRQPPLHLLEGQLALEHALQGRVLLRTVRALAAQSRLKLFLALPVHRGYPLLLPLVELTALPLQSPVERTPLVRPLLALSLQGTLHMLHRRLPLRLAALEGKSILALEATAALHAPGVVRAGRRKAGTNWERADLSSGLPCGDHALPRGAGAHPQRARARGPLAPCARPAAGSPPPPAGLAPGAPRRPQSWLCPA